MRHAVCALTILFLLFAVTSANAGEKDQLTVDLSTNVWAKYLNQGGGVPHNGAVAWSSVFVTHNRSGLFAGVWNSSPIDGSKWDADFGTENDLYLGWRGETGKVGYNAGVAYFDLHEIGGTARGDLMQVWGEADYTFASGRHELVPFVRLEYSVPPPVADTALNSSLRALLGAGYTFQLDPRTSLKAKAWLIADDGRNNRGDEAFIGQLDLGVQFKLTTRLSAHLGLRLSEPLTPTVDRRFEVVPSVGLSLRF